MIILRAAGHAAAPWKNGRGMTREIAARPIGAGLDDFEWRISMAVVDAGGSFSSFPGIDRILTVLAGRMSLTVDGSDPVELGEGSPPFGFPGDVQVDAGVRAGPITDLNVMTRRGKAKASVKRIRTKTPLEIEIKGTMLLFAEADGSIVRCAGEDHALHQHDAAIIEGERGGLIHIKSSGGTALLLVQISEDRG